MKTAKYLTVKVTYKVSLENVEMPEKVYDQLFEASEEGYEIDGTGMDTTYLEASEWLRDNIKEEDCHDLEYEIDNLL